MGNNLSGADGKRLYVDFEPFCQWHRKEAQDTLDIHLHNHSFKKDQLHVVVDKGLLTVWGEKPIDPPKWHRFRKEVKLERQHMEDEIRSHFSLDGVLSITIPKGPTFGHHLRNSFSKVSSKFTKSMSSKFKVGDGNWLSKLENVVLLHNLLMMLLFSFAIYVTIKSS